MNQSEECFQHSALDHSTNAIRLIQILPGPDRRAIRCSIRHASVHAHYYALSYRWGSAAHLRVIFLDDKPFLVGDNLWNFLYTARNKGYIEMNFWIDAMCIDQNNIAERNHQVRQMGLIYTNASIVCVWLGLSFDEPSLVDQVLDLSEYERCREVRERVRVKIQDLRSSEAEWVSVLCAIVHASYWKRLWIVQEIILAKSLLVFPGNMCSPHFNLESWIEESHNSGYVYPSVRVKRYIRNSLAATLLEDRKHILDNGQLTRDIGELLRRYGNSKCSDTRDRVYGLLSLARGAENLPVDYSIQKMELLMQIMVFHKTQDILYFAAEVSQLLQLQREDVDSPPIADGREATHMFHEEDSDRIVNPRLKLILMGFRRRAPTSPSEQKPECRRVSLEELEQEWLEDAPELDSPRGDLVYSIEGTHICLVGQLDFHNVALYQHLNRNHPRLPGDRTAPVHETSSTRTLPLIEEQMKDWRERHSGSRRHRPERHTAESKYKDGTFAQDTNTIYASNILNQHLSWHTNEGLQSTIVTEEQKPLSLRSQIWIRLSPGVLKALLIARGFYKLGDDYLPHHALCRPSLEEEKTVEGQGCEHPGDSLYIYDSEFFPSPPPL